MNKKRKRVRNIIIVVAAILLLTFGGMYAFAQIYKKEILTAISNAINEKLSGSVAIRDVNFTLFSNFPSLSLTLSEVTVRDSLYPVHHQELFHAGKVYLQIDVTKLLRGEINLKTITIQNASCSLLKMQNGYSNFNIVRKDTSLQKTPTSSSFETTVNKVILNRVQFSMVDSSRNKWFRFQFRHVESDIEQHAPVTNAVISGSIHFDGLTFNPDKGSYLLNKDLAVKIKLNYDAAKQAIKIFPSDIKSTTSDFSLHGNFSFAGAPHMHLEIYAPKISMSEAPSIVTQNIADKLAAYALENPAMIAVFIDGSIAPGSKPAADVYFKTTDNILDLKTKSFTGTTMLGWFTNHIDTAQINDDHNSRLVIPHFTGNLGGVPLQAKMIITDLLDPHLFMDAKVNMRLDDANDLVDSTLMSFGGGSISVSFNYDGKLVNYVDTANEKLLAKVHGKLDVANGQVTYLPRGFDFTNINTSMEFNDSVLTIEYVDVSINKNPIRITGNIKRFIPFLFLPKYNLVADLQVNAPSLNFDNFKPSASIVQSTKKKAQSKKASQKKISEVVSAIIDMTNAEINLSAGQITSRKFKSTDIRGTLSISDDNVQFKDVNMKTSDGLFSLKGSITSLEKPPYHLNINTAITNVDISSLFYSFDNFQQKVVTHDNVKGKLTTRINFDTQLKKDYSILPESMRGKIILQIKNGALVNLNALDELSKYVFKDRDFKHIEFAQLKDTLTLKGQQMELSRMEIQTSLLSLFVEGTYGFNGGTDISIQIPLSNLKKRDIDYKPSNIGTDAKIGPSVFLRAVDGADGKIVFKYDPFKNYYKDKANKNKNQPKAQVDQQSISADQATDSKGKKK